MDDLIGTGLFYDFIEIGTSDFDTLIQNATAGTLGLSIDPVAHYLDRLPCPSGCSKLNAAISDREGEVAVYFVRPDLIQTLGLPDWLRGCNSIGNPHPTVASLIKDMKLPPDIVVESRVPMYRVQSVLERFNIDGVFFLKLDTEGHDATILEEFFESATVRQYPHQLLFESNILSDNDRIHRLIAKLLLSGYDIVRAETGGGATDTLLRLNISRIPDRTRFMPGIRGYYLAGYPAGYDPEQPPHGNTLAEACQYCLATGQGGVTYQFGRYEVREGKFLGEHKSEPELQSWLLMP